MTASIDFLPWVCSRIEQALSFSNDMQIIRTADRAHAAKRFSLVHKKELVRIICVGVTPRMDGLSQSIELSVSGAGEGNLVCTVSLDSLGGLFGIEKALMEHKRLALITYPPTEPAPVAADPAGGAGHLLEALEGLFGPMDGLDGAKLEDFGPLATGGPQFPPFSLNQQREQGGNPHA